MVFNLATVAGTVAPALVSTFFSHIKDKKLRAEKPTSNLSYEEGLVAIRKFLEYASENTVEDLQRFSSQWVPHPHSVKVDTVNIPDQFFFSAARSLQIQHGPDGIEEIGGKTWWQWRRPGSKLSAEWIEMRDHFKGRVSGKSQGSRIIMYIHGGAYFFGSVAQHRLQMQNYARHLKARIFAPTYRLAPQFPFPCGLQDCLAAYMYLITMHDPTTILLAGDSAGGGMILSIMVILRDQNLPLPAGAILISPWVDLTHSFPSILEENPLDYIPKEGFFYKPSESWPPPPSDDVPTNEEITHSEEIKESTTFPPLIEGDPRHGFYVRDTLFDGEISAEKVKRDHNYYVSAVKTKKQKIEISILHNGKQVRLLEQVQLYAPNFLLPHPLVSPVFQPSLGGLPPLFILTGGGETLRDEQIYLAHKAANPSKYPPGDHLLKEGDLEKISRWKPTYVQLQVWDDMCHVAPILSFSSPVKHVYRSIAQFGYRAYHRAQKAKSKKNENNNCSINAMLNAEAFPEEPSQIKPFKTNNSQDDASVGRIGDAPPPYQNFMIRQRVDFHGNFCSLKPESELVACNMNPSDIGIVKIDGILRWIEAKQKWDMKYATLRRRIQERQEKKRAEGKKLYPNDENPPPSALIARLRVKGGASSQ